MVGVGQEDKTMSEKSETLSGSANGQTRHMNKAHASSGTCSYAGEVLDRISGIKLKDDNSVYKAETGLEITTRPLYASYPITYENVTYLYYFE